MDFNLDNRIAIVTGGSRGIGRAISERLAKHGAHVIVSSRNIESCNEVVNALKSSGLSADSFACDTGNLEDIRRLIQHVERKHGNIDILVNNSAANPWFGPLLELDIDAYEKTVDVNLKGTLFTAIEAAKIMAKAGGGTIINTGSINAYKPVIGQGIYSITKGALITLTKSLAKECGHLGIRVNAILPGITRTDSIEHIFKETGDLPQKWKSQIPLSRHALPEDMAGAVVLLASDSSSYITGACLTIDGGLTL